MNIAQRSLTSSAYNVAANTIQITINFVRSVILARLLAPEIFGLYTFVSSIIGLTQVLPNYGLTGAFLAHPEHDQKEALKVHFTLTMLFNSAWALLLGIFAAIFASPETRWAFWIVTAAVLVSQLTQTPRAALTKAVAFRRLALMETLVTMIDSAVAIWMAWKGYGLWSLLIANLVGSLVAVTVLYAFRPAWKPGLGWSRPILRDFLRFGSKVLAGMGLLQALDRLDDIWTKIALGNQALGFYDRAYGFATYPRRVLSKPISDVAMGTYAQLRDDRKRLSQAFFRVNALMIRVNFLFAGWLALIAPEFIRILLGSAWLPMLTAFRLMLIYTLLDPIKLTIANLIVTSGKPEKVNMARLVQLAVMIVGLAVLTPRFGISGVALAVDLMLVVGIVILLVSVREFVDFSLPKLVLPPLISLGAGMAVTLAVLATPFTGESDLRTAGFKTAIFSLSYSGILLVWEKKRLLMLVTYLQHLRAGLRKDFVTDD